jgi:hypothetical protein
MHKYKVTLLENGNNVVREIFASNSDEAYLRANHYLISYNNNVSIHSIVKVDDNINYNISEAV